jgi:hypothetical protein
VREGGTVRNLEKNQRVYGECREVEVWALLGECFELKIVFRVFGLMYLE